MSPVAINPKIKARNAEIVEARRNGTMSLGQLAKKYQISRERVRQIAAGNGVDQSKANEAYRRRRQDQAFADAEKHASAILMRFIAGDSVRDIAAAVGVQIKIVQEVLDEQVTDGVLAARANNRAAARFPDAVVGPRDEAREPRDDRYWTEQLVFDALVKLARSNNGRLPSSTRYQKLAPKRDDLPSFSTVRNRLGRWSTVRANVHAVI